MVSFLIIDFPQNICDYDYYIIRLLCGNYTSLHCSARCIKNSNLRKEVGIAIKSKETSSQFESVRNSYVAIMHQPVTVCSTM